MRDLAAFAAIVAFVAGLYAVASPAAHHVQSARLDAAVTLTADR